MAITGLQKYCAKIAAKALRHDFHKPLDSIGLEAHNILELIDDYHNLGIKREKIGSVSNICGKICRNTTAVSEQMHDFSEKIDVTSTFRIEYEFKQVHNLVNPILNEIQDECMRLNNIFKKSLDNDIRHIGRELLSDSKKIIKMYGGITHLVRINSIDNDSFQPVFLNSLIQSAANLSTSSFRGTTTVKILINGDARCDIIKSHITTLFVNLIDNAIKFTKNVVDPHIEVTIKTDRYKKISERHKKTAGRYAGRGEWVEIQVSDNGLGIAPDERSYIFDLYATSNDPIYNPSGTGIGLAIVKVICTLHGGLVFLKQTSDKGSNFIVLLPIENRNGLEISTLSAAELGL